MSRHPKGPITAVRVQDTINDWREVRYRRGDREDFHREAGKALDQPLDPKKWGKVSDWPVRYAVQGMNAEGEVVADNGGVGGVIRVFTEDGLMRNPAARSKVLGRTRNPITWSASDQVWVDKRVASTLMPPWESGGGSTYQIGSMGRAGKPVPLAVAQTALSQFEQMQADAKLGKHGWDAKDARQLGTIVRAIKAGIKSASARRNPASRKALAKYHGLISAGRFEDAAKTYKRIHGGLKGAHARAAKRSGVKRNPHTWTQHMHLGRKRYTSTIDGTRFVLYQNDDGTYNVNRFDNDGGPGKLVGKSYTYGLAEAKRVAQHGGVKRNPTYTWIDEPDRSIASAGGGRFQVARTWETGRYAKSRAWVVMWFGPGQADILNEARIGYAATREAGKALAGKARRMGSSR